MYKKFAFILSLSLLFAVSACTNSVIEEQAYTELTDSDESLHIVLFGGAYRNIDLFIDYFNEHISDTEIIVERLDSGEAGKYSEQLRTGILSGNAPDIIHIRSDLDYDLSNSPYLTDLMMFIENDPEFNIDDYYMNVIEALKLNGRLPYIPISFDMNFVGINSECTELIEEFNNLDTASYKQLIDLYHMMPKRYDYEFCPQFYVLDVIYSSDYIDFRNRTASYDSEELIENLKEALEMNGSISAAATSNYIPEFGDTHLFHAVSYMERRLFMPYKEPYIYFNSDPSIGDPVNVPSEFIDFKPLTNNKGQLPFYSITFPALAITEGSSKKDIAWEFIKLLLSDDSYDIFNDANAFYTANSHQIYMNKNVDRKMSEDFFTGYIKDELGTDTLPDDILLDIENTVNKLQTYAGMPMVHENAFPSKLNSDINDVIQLLVSGQLTPEQTAQRLQLMTELVFQE